MENKNHVPNHQPALAIFSKNIYLRVVVFDLPYFSPIFGCSRFIINNLIAKDDLRSSIKTINMINLNITIRTP